MSVFITNLPAVFFTAKSLTYPVAGAANDLYCRTRREVSREASRRVRGEARSCGSQRSTEAAVVPRL